MGRNGGKSIKIIRRSKAKARFGKVAYRLGFAREFAWHVLSAIVNYDSRRVCGNEEEYPLLLLPPWIV